MLDRDFTLAALLLETITLPPLDTCKEFHQVQRAGGRTCPKIKVVSLKLVMVSMERSIF